MLQLRFILKCENYGCIRSLIINFQIRQILATTNFYLFIYLFFCGGEDNKPLSFKSTVTQVIISKKTSIFPV